MKGEKFKLKPILTQSYFTQDVHVEGLHISILGSELENCVLQKRTASEINPRTLTFVQCKQPFRGREQQSEEKKLQVNVTIWTISSAFAV